MKKEQPSQLTGEGPAERRRCPLIRKAHPARASCETPALKQEQKTG